MRDCRLECVQAVIERQKRMPAEANDDRLFLDRQHRRSRFLWSRPSVHDRAARLPLAHRLLIDAVTSGERSQALFTMLYRSTDRLSRRGAPVKTWPIAHPLIRAIRMHHQSAGPNILKSRSDCARSTSPLSAVL